MLAKGPSKGVSRGSGASVNGPRPSFACNLGVGMNCGG